MSHVMDDFKSDYDEICCIGLFGLYGLFCYDLPCVADVGNSNASPDESITQGSPSWPTSDDDCVPYLTVLKRTVTLNLRDDRR